MTSFRNGFEFDSVRMEAAAAAAIFTVGVAAFSKGITALGWAHFFVSIAIASTPT